MKDKHKYLVQELESNPELSEFLYDVLSSFRSYNTRQLLVAVKGKEYDNAVDTAIPQPWADKLRQDMSLQPFYIMWDYNDQNCWGKPFNLAAETLIKMSKLVRNK